MKIRKIKDEIEEMLSEKHGIMLYAVLKTKEEKIVKFLNIADEDDDSDNTSSDLLKGFTEIIRNKFAVYNEDDEIIKLSSADERKNALYYYDLDELPMEMERLKGISETLSAGEVFNFKEDSLNQIIALASHLFVLEKANYTYNHSVIRQAGRPTHLPVICSIPSLLYKKNYKEKIGSGNHFHNVLCLSEAKGMDIIM